MRRRNGETLHTRETSVHVVVQYLFEPFPERDWEMPICVTVIFTIGDDPPSRAYAVPATTASPSARGRAAFASALAASRFLRWSTSARIRNASATTSGSAVFVPSTK